MSIYGKKKAYDMCVRLSHCVNGLRVEAAPRRKQDGIHRDKREYHREWRANNKDKVREYNRRSYLKRKQKKILEQYLEEGAERMQEAESIHHESYIDYLRWMRADIPQSMKEELERMSDSEISEYFGKNLEFGTGGLRAEIGLGTNRLNIYTVRKATQGLADYLKTLPEPRSVAIGYDSRRMSREFAEQTACVLAQNGIKAYLFDELCPTPLLSYAVRQLQASAGVMITASHNPPSDNGYKVYGADGAQITSQTARDIMTAIDQVEDELTVAAMAMEDAIEQGLLVSIGQDVVEQYYERLQTIIQDPSCIREQADKLSIVYTPLHGTGNVPVREALRRAGFNRVCVVPEQEKPDGDFPTVRSPNPEDHQALQLAIRLAREWQADIVLATDPDADRVGIAVRDRRGDYWCLNGNETGALMLDYLLMQKRRSGRLPESGVILKTIVTSELGRLIASSYGVETMDTLTGFKYIGEMIGKFESAGDKQFLFGYEESYGYLIGDFVRDKDAVQACLFISEMAAYYKQQGMTLLERLKQLHEQFGYYEESQHSITLKGIEGMVRMNEIMNYLRQSVVPRVDGWRVSWIRDFERGTELHLSSNMLRSIGLPRSNVLHYSFVNGSWFAIRPSGTEPKLKIYFSTVAQTREEAKQMMDKLRASVLELIDNIQIHLGLQVVPKQ